jgi:hypothetical protein
MYGYYMDRMLFKQVVDHYSEHPLSVEMGAGAVYLARAGVIEVYVKGVDIGPKYGILSLEAGVFSFHYPIPVTGAVIPDMLDSSHYWKRNWPVEFGECGHR